MGRPKMSLEVRRMATSDQAFVWRTLSMALALAFKGFDRRYRMAAARGWVNWLMTQCETYVMYDTEEPTCVLAFAMHPPGMPKPYVYVMPNLRSNGVGSQLKKSLNKLTTRRNKHMVDK